MLACVIRPDWRVVLDTMTAPSSIAEIRCSLDGVWADHPEIPGDVRVNMLAAAVEIGANIVEHSGRDRPVRMTVQFRLSPQRAEIRFTDDGAPADVDTDAVTMPPPLALRGRGLAIAKAILDDVSYRRVGDLNVWVLMHQLTDR